MDVITSTQELEKIIDNLSSEEFVTIDTEFHREKTYYPLLCLVQIAGKNNAYLIDPLADGIDISSIKKLLINKDVLKIFHASYQDMEILYYLCGAIPDPIFDTQVAAQIVGIGESVGYGKLVEDICGVTLDKSSRHTDWCKRPLTKKQMDYAISDVIYLRDIYLFLKNKISSMGRKEWMDEEIEKIMDIELYKNSPENAWKKMKMNNNRGKFRSIVKELAIWREGYAQDVNRPKSWILKNDAIYEIASISPESEGDLSNLRFYKPSDKNINKAIMDIVNVAVNKEYPPVVKNKGSRNSSKYLVDMMKILLKIQCDKHNVVPSVVVRADDIENLANSDDKDMPVLNGWRYDIYGKYALDLKDGKIALAIEDGDVKLIDYKE